MLLLLGLGDDWGLHVGKLHCGDFGTGLQVCDPQGSQFSAGAG